MRVAPNTKLGKEVVDGEKSRDRPSKQEEGVDDVKCVDSRENRERRRRHERERERLGGGRPRCRGRQCGFVLPPSFRIILHQRLVRLDLHTHAHTHTRTHTHTHTHARTK